MAWFCSTILDQRHDLRLFGLGRGGEGGGARCLVGQGRGGRRRCCGRGGRGGTGRSTEKTNDRHDWSNRFGRFFLFFLSLFTFFLGAILTLRLRWHLVAERFVVWRQQQNSHGLCNGVQSTHDQVQARFNPTATMRRSSISWFGRE